MSSPLAKEFQFYLDNQSKIVEEYNGRVVVIKGGRIIGVYNEEITAITETQKTNEIGSFLIQKVEPGDQAYTQTFHSRVTFS